MSSDYGSPVEKMRISNENSTWLTLIASITPSVYTTITITRAEPDPAGLESRVLQGADNHARRLSDIALEFDLMVEAGQALDTTFSRPRLHPRLFVYGKVTT